MSQQLTGSYDTFIALTQSGLERLIQASFIESMAYYGLPMEYETDSEIDVALIDDPIKVSVKAHLDLPNVTLPSGTLTYPTPAATSREIIANALDIIIPFKNKAFIFDSPFIPSITCLNGRLVIILPLIDAEGILKIDTNSLHVALRYAEDDPDPNDDNKTSQEKVSLLQPQLENMMTKQFREEPPEVLAAIANNPGLGTLLGVNNSPSLAGVGPQPPSDPVITQPSTFLGLDPELQTAPAALPTNEMVPMVMAKTKQSARSLALGTANEPLLGDNSWVRADSDVGVYVANRFLLNEMIAPQLMRGLLKEQLANVDEDDETAVLAVVRQYFLYPFTLVQPIPYPLPLPSISQNFPNIPLLPQSEDPNAVIRSLDVTVDDSLVTVRITVTGREIGYHFTANVVVQLAYSHSLGQLEVLPFSHPPVVNIQFDPWVYVTAAIVGFLSPAMGGVVLAPLLLLLADIGLDPWVSSQFADAVEMPETQADLGGLFDVLVLNRVILDDLYLGGNFRIAHALNGEPEPTAVLTESRCLAQEELHHLGANPSTLIAFDQQDVVTITATEIQPLNGTTVTPMGIMPHYQADNLSQADLHEPTLNYTNNNINHAEAVQTVADDPLAEPVMVVGVQTARQQFGYLIVWHTIDGYVRAFARIYRKLPAGLYLTQWAPETVLDVTSVKQHVLAGNIGHGGSSGSISNCQLVSTMGEQIDLPFGNPINVGSSSSDCYLDMIVVATPVLLRAPLSLISWSVIRSDGSQEAIPSDNDPVTINTGTNGNNIEVTFHIAEPELQQCQVTTVPGQNVDFTLRAAIVEKYDVVQTTEIPIQLVGTKTSVFGYDHWVNEFEKLRTFVWGELDGGRGPDPIPYDEIFGRGIEYERNTTRPESVGDIDRYFSIAQPSLTAVEFIQLNEASAGARGVRATDRLTVRSHRLYQAGFLDSQRHRPNPALFGDDALAHLHQIVKDTFSAFRRHYGESERLERYESVAIASLQTLPNPRTLRNTSSKGDKHMQKITKMNANITELRTIIDGDSMGESMATKMPKQAKGGHHG